MNQKYDIFWFVNSFVDEKASISPRLEMLSELRKLGNNATMVAAYKAKKPSLNIDTVFLNIVAVPLLSTLYFNVRCLFAFFNRFILHKKTIIIADQRSLYGALLLKLKYRIFNNYRIKVHFDIRTVPVELKGIKSLLEMVLYWRPSLILAYHFADSFSFISTEIEKIANFKNKKVCVWSSGVNLKKFVCSNDHNDQINHRILYYHGVITSNRGLRETILAIDKVKDIIQNIKFVLVGDGFDRYYLKKLVEEKGLCRHIEFTGKVEYKDIHRYLQKAEVCICPLPDIQWWRVSSPLKVLEYLAMGKPCILTSITPHLNLIPADTHGIYWAGKGSPDELANSIIEAFNCEPDPIRYYSHLRKIAEKNTWQQKALLLSNYWYAVFQE
jgi:glycosyltransferase involved in cell wall biosynthesis